MRVGNLPAERPDRSAVRPPARDQAPSPAGRRQDFPTAGNGHRCGVGGGGLALALWLSIPAGLYVLLYLLVTIAYSLSLKRKIFADVIALAVLFTVRVAAGGVATSIPLSQAFLAFSI